MSIVTIIGAIIASFLVLSGLFLSKGAPQEAAAAGLACAFCIIPYVVFRVVQIGTETKARKKFYADVLGKLDAMQKPAASPTPD